MRNLAPSPWPVGCRFSSLTAIGFIHNDIMLEMYNHKIKVFFPSVLHVPENVNFANEQKLSSMFDPGPGAGNESTAL